MEWIGITGSWRKTSPKVQSDVQREILGVMEAGNGIVTGGALGVDYLATDVALNYAPDGSRLKVFLPTSLEAYVAHYRNRSHEGVITTEQTEDLIHQLETVQKLGALSVNPHETVVDEHTYYLRNTQVMQASDALLAFQINSSGGVQDTIDKARSQSMPVKVFNYTIE